jgi:stearoyl-CoA desaturase (delta-9 desaturase)
MLAIHLAISAFLAPSAMGPLKGLLIGTSYFVFVWFCTGMYLANVLHLGTAHRALDIKPWFAAALTFANSLFAVHVNPIDWVNRHRNHHSYSDHDGDPNKLAEDGFWRTLYRSFSSYRCRVDHTKDPRVNTWAFRTVSKPYFAAIAQGSSFLFAWLVANSWLYALALWASVRLLALWSTMILNYWTHDRRFGTRRYASDQGNSVNIVDPMVITATFSTCWQNNHHHYPNLARMTHDNSEYDFGLYTVRLLKRMGLARPSSSGARLPDDLPIAALGL